MATILTSTATFAAQGEPYSVGPEPAWAEPVPIPAVNDELEVANGVRYLVADEQVDARGDAVASYVHMARQFTDGNGVTDSAQISISFDPSYQDLVVHRVVVHRGGEVRDRLTSARIEVMQREAGLDRQIYDGSLTLLIVPQDVRVGDTLEYSFTRHGQNPILGGFFVDDSPMRWQVPLQRYAYRLLWPDGRRLRHRVHSDELEPMVKAVEGGAEYRWRRDDIPALLVDEDRPIWFHPFPWLQLSEFESWAAVARWGSRLFATPRDPSAPIEALARRLAKGANSREERTLRALHYIQNEVRYLGMEFGVNSYKPSPAKRVLRQRFGDCKDKTGLLVALLRAMDVDADPALVSTGYRDEVSDLLPSPAVFDHAIARANVAGQTYWLDPTRLYQAGPLDAHALPRYGKALVLDADTVDLAAVVVPDAAAHRVFVEQRLDLTVEPATMKVVTTYDGGAAEDVRADVAQTPASELGKSYADYYARLYPGLEETEPFRVDDNAETGRIRVFESYRVGSAWETADDGLKTLDLYPMELSSYLTIPKVRGRTMPLARRHPVDIRHRITARVEDQWRIENDASEVAGPGFRFSEATDYANNEVVLDYRYRSTADHVAVADLAEHRDQLKAATAALGVQLLLRPEDWSSSRLNWPVLLLAIVASIFWLWLGRRIYRYDPVPRDPPGEIPEAYRKIGGWLYLVALNVYVVPLATIATAHKSITSPLSTAVWNSVTASDATDFHPLWAPLLIFEMVGVIGVVVTGVLVAVLFTQKRHTFPRVMIAWLVARVAFVALGMTGAHVVGVAASADMATTVRRTLAPLLWIAYLSSSERVRHTFLKRRPGTPQPPAEPRRDRQEAPAGGATTDVAEPG